MLFSCDDRVWGSEPISRTLPSLLEPMGVCCRMARTARESAALVEHERIHIAVVDLAIPMDDQDDHTAGHRVLQLLRRLQFPPITVVVRPRQVNDAAAVRGLHDAMREGAFAVHDRPLGLEPLLQTLQRAVQRHFAGHWPAA
ncbi:MAG: hypothetical protein O2819_05520 [Planctomycetota bacterium]|nr:hypothetical protein [Planctomycetota bacterium]